MFVVWTSGKSSARFFPGKSCALLNIESMTWRSTSWNISPLAGSSNTARFEGKGVIWPLWIASTESYVTWKSFPIININNLNTLFWILGYVPAISLTRDSRSFTCNLFDAMRDSRGQSLDGRPTKRSMYAARSVECVSTSGCDPSPGKTHCSWSMSTNTQNGLTYVFLGLCGAVRTSRKIPALISVQVNCGWRKSSASASRLKLVNRSEPLCNRN